MGPLRVLALLVLTLVCMGVVGGVLPAALTDLPSAGELAAHPMGSDSMVYDRTGSVLLADLHPPGYRHYEQALRDMGTYLPEATVAIEDANFWVEPGLDPGGMT